MDVHPILAGLDDEQRAVATCIDGPVVVLAGAGTGKTRAMTHRIAYAVDAGAHEAHRSMALTFTTRAAGELRSRLRALGAESVAARTFHSAALRQLRHFWPRISGGDFPVVLASKARLVGEAAASIGVRADVATIRDLAADIEWAKAHELAPEDLARHPMAQTRTWSLDAPVVIGAYAAYEELKKDRQLIDFEDVLLVLVQVLRVRADIAAEVRGAYRWFTVDEYQDVNHLQHELLRLWLGDRDDLCVVGDASQTIYAFTGASSSYLTGFTGEFPQATEVRLVTCYRCARPIVDVANAVIAESHQPGVLHLNAVRPQGARPTIREFDDDVQEAGAVADQVRALLDSGTEPRQIAVLFRINAQSAELEAAMTDRAIPVVMRGGERFFERAEIREASTRLRGAARAGQASGPVPQEVRAVLAGMGWGAEPPRAPGAARERWESLSALAALADEWAEDQGDVSAFVAELDRRAQAGHAPEANAVTLASLHAAKGLEWTAVFLVGCSEGLLPIHYAQTEAQIEEERRLAYVGITRARETLHLSWARARQPGGRPTRRISRFLEASVLADGSSSGRSRGSVRPGDPSRGRSGNASPDRVRRGPKGPAKCRICGKGLVTAPERTVRRCRTCPTTVNADVIDSIKEWRLAKSRDLGVPAYVICTDATVLAIAEMLPGTAAELMEIPGIGPAKLEQHGSELLALVQAAGSGPP